MVDNFPQRLTNVVPIFPKKSLARKEKWDCSHQFEYDNSTRRAGNLTDFPDLTDTHAESLTSLLGAPYSDRRLAFKGVSQRHGSSALCRSARTIVREIPSKTIGTLCLLIDYR